MLRTMGPVVAAWLALGLALGVQGSDAECGQPGNASDETPLLQSRSRLQSQDAEMDEGSRSGRMTEDPLFCTDAEPQSPRDVTDTFRGERRARYEPLEQRNVRKLIQVNLHFHLGAEHFSYGEYDIPAGNFKPPEGGKGEILPADVQPGFFCSLDDLKPEELQSYTFEHCNDTFVGYTYEFHWVYSSGGPIAEPFRLYTGLDQVFNRSIDPEVIVRGQACRIIFKNLKTQQEIEEDYANFLEQWRQPPLGQGVRYVGSTTGPSYDNTVCSPAEVHWHVDQKCCTLSAEALDLTCKNQRADGLVDDVRPQGSRILVDKAFTSVVTYPLQDDEEGPPFDPKLPNSYHKKFKKYYRKPANDRKYYSRKGDNRKAYYGSENYKNDKSYENHGSYGNSETYYKNDKSYENQGSYGNSQAYYSQKDNGHYGWWRRGQQWRRW